MKGNLSLYAIAILISVLFFGYGAHAQGLSLEIPICTLTDSQNNLQLIPDGDGGVIVAWNDVDVYVQRIDEHGNPLWPGDGVVICGAGGLQTHPQIVSDGSMGAIVVWLDDQGDDRSDDTGIYAQRIDADGNILWGTYGVAVYPEENFQYTAGPMCISDGEGGVVVAWYDCRDAFFNNCWAQRINAEGDLLWPEDGVKIIGDNPLSYMDVTTDGAGGIIIAIEVWWWEPYPLIWVKRVNADGELSYNGVRVCEASGDQNRPKICPDGGGGAFITWIDRRSGDFDIYIQRLDNSGNRLWYANGVAVSSAYGDQVGPNLIRDDDSGVIVTWVDGRSGDYDIYAQRMDANGNFMWNTNGIAVCTAPENQAYENNYGDCDLGIASNESSGAVITWHDYRNGGSDIYAQLVNLDGTVSWETDGIEICTVDSAQTYPRIVSNRPGESFIAWTDMRSGGMDIYGLYVAEEAQILDALMDIRPGSCPNPLNPRSQGVLPVAILGTIEFDVADIDPATILLEGVQPLRWNIEDVATPVSNGDNCACTNDGSDGFDDLTLKFSTPEIVSALEDYFVGEEKYLTITGSLNDGTTFEASDCVIIRGPKEEMLVREDSKDGRLLLKSSPTDPVQLISFDLPKPSYIEATVYDVSGRVVARLNHSVGAAGANTVKWNAAGLASGMYFLQVRAGELRMTRKMLILR